MPKLFTFFQLLCILLMVSCGKNDDDEKYAFELLEIKTEDDYLDASNEKGYIFISKADGSLIDVKQFKNNQTITLGTNESGIETFTTTIFVHKESSIPYKNQFRSYLEVPKGTSWVLDLDRSIYEPTLDSARIVVNNIGDIDVNSINVSSGWRPVNTYISNDKLYVSAAATEEVSIYLSYKNLSDNKMRYLFEEGLMPNAEVDFEHESLPVIESPTILTYPSGIFGFIDEFYVKGEPDSTSNNSLFINTGNDLTSPFEYYAPNNVFEKINTSVSGSIISGGKFAVSTRTASPITTIEISNYNYEATADINGFSFSSNSPFETFVVLFHDESNGLTWNVYSEKKPAISFAFPVTPNELLMEFPVLSNPHNFSYITSSASKYTPSFSFSEIIKKGLLGKQLNYTKVETIGKDL